MTHTFELTATKVWRGGKKSRMVRRQVVPVELTARADEICLWFDQGGPERESRIEVRLGQADFLQLIQAIGMALHEGRSRPSIQELLISNVPGGS